MEERERLIQRREADLLAREHDQLMLDLQVVGVEYERDLGRWASELDRRRQLLEGDEARLQERLQDASRLAATLADREEALRVRARELAEIETAHAKTAHALEREAAQSTKHAQDLVQLRATMSVQQSALAAFRAELEVAHAALDERATAVDARVRALYADEKKLRHATAEAERRQAELDRLASDQATVAAELHSRRAELEQQRKQLAVKARALSEWARDLDELARRLAREREELRSVVEPYLAATNGSGNGELVQALLEEAALSQLPAARWQVDTLGELVERHADDFPEHVLEWQTYVDVLSQHTDDGRMVPAHLNGVVLDIFGPLLEHSVDAEAEAPIAAVSARTQRARAAPGLD